MIQRRDRLRCAAQFSTALCAVHNFVVAAFLRAGSRHFVLAHRSSGLVITVDDRNRLYEQPYSRTAVGTRICTKCSVAAGQVMIGAYREFAVGVSDRTALA